MNFNNEQAAKYLKILHDAGLNSAIVAGGAVRDSIFGKPVKDIDFFVSHEDVVEYELKHLSPVNEKQGLATLSEPFGIEVEMASFGTYASIPDVHSVYNVFTGTPEVNHLGHIIGPGSIDNSLIPMQIVVMEPGMTPFQRIDTFDFGFCQAGWNGDKVVTTPVFDEDYANKTISLVYCENQYEWTRSMTRYERLSQKYPEFKLVCKPQDSYPVLVIKSETELDVIGKELFGELSRV